MRQHFPIERGKVATTIARLWEIKNRNEDPATYSHSPLPYDRLSTFSRSFLSLDDTPMKVASKPSHQSLFEYANKADRAERRARSTRSCKTISGSKPATRGTGTNLKEYLEFSASPPNVNYVPLQQPTPQRIVLDHRKTIAARMEAMIGSTEDSLGNVSRSTSAPNLTNDSQSWEDSNPSWPREQGDHVLKAHELERKLQDLASERAAGLDLEPPAKPLSIRKPSLGERIRRRISIRTYASEATSSSDRKKVKTADVKGHGTGGGGSGDMETIYSSKRVAVRKCEKSHENVEFYDSRGNTTLLVTVSDSPMKGEPTLALVPNGRKGKYRRCEACDRQK